jgi:hypothetical protein
MDSDPLKKTLLCTVGKTACFVDSSTGTLIAKTDLSRLTIDGNRSLFGGVFVHGRRQDEILCVARYSLKDNTISDVKGKFVCFSNVGTFVVGHTTDIGRYQIFDFIKTEPLATINSCARSGLVLVFGGRTLISVPPHGDAMIHGASGWTAWLPGETVNHVCPLGLDRVCSWNDQKIWVTDADGGRFKWCEDITNVTFEPQTDCIFIVQRDPAHQSLTRNIELFRADNLETVWQISPTIENLMLVYMLNTQYYVIGRLWGGPSTICSMVTGNPLYSFATAGVRELHMPMGSEMLIAYVDDQICAYNMSTRWSIDAHHLDCQGLRSSTRAFFHSASQISLCTDLVLTAMSFVERC